MSKAVLISIRPKWCELIASGEKTIEVRKTRPKQEPPFKCYIYCTKAKVPITDSHGIAIMYEDDLAILKGWRSGIGNPCGMLGIGEELINGKVFCEFICDQIIEWHYIPDPDESADPGSMAYDVLTVDGEKTCLEYDEFEDYGKGAQLYGWHISDLVIYDEPKALSEFTGLRKTKFGYAPYEITRPPQSWCYVEELV